MTPRVRFGPVSYKVGPNLDNFPDMYFAGYL